ncbi:hypothetical protein KC717_02570 [Candidatus Dojkabacteria bacterium]|uniref:Uncharacterized protein n=1 Tax=Candidatus Dojkabacteria bacterium TaxID=2099670 RepID=A0A955L8B7_9BACT|nr:hypothetical protein [Candidatus Dojkabacteria bacterium]
MKKQTKYIVGLLVLSFVVFCGVCSYIFWFTFLIPNTFQSLTEEVYVIPKESSMWTFDATKYNPGSGDWWVYGEDSMYYYHYTGEGIDTTYEVISREDASQCSGFDKHDHSTWCGVH